MTHKEILDQFIEDYKRYMKSATTPEELEEFTRHIELPEETSQ